MTLPFLGYLLASLVVGFLLTIVVSMFRPTKKTDEFKSWYWIIGFTIVAGFAPYGYAEFMTRKWGAGMKKPIEAALIDARVAGKLKYYRVLAADPKNAKVVAVAEERGDFGEPETTVVQIEMIRSKSSWAAATYEFVNSYKRQKDGATLPPYW
jgi:hypothetical protein